MIPDPCGAFLDGGAFGSVGEADALDARVQEAEQVLDPVAVLRLLELEFIVLCLNLE